MKDGYAGCKQSECTDCDKNEIPLSNVHSTKSVLFQTLLCEMDPTMLDLDKKQNFNLEMFYFSDSIFTTATNTTITTSTTTITIAITTTTNAIVLLLQTLLLLILLILHHRNG